MVISHNLNAINANRQLNIVTGIQADHTEKLSSGYRVNRAADDAAGLSISEKMRRQIRGLRQGIENTLDGISLCQTAEGALNEVHSMLHRLEELSVQAANDTNSGEDRQAIQDEIDQILSEIDRISDISEFNGRKIFGGGTATGTGAVSGTGATSGTGAAGPSTICGDFTVAGGTLGTDYTFEDGVLKIISNKTITIRNTNSGVATTNRIEVASGVNANITLAGVNIDVSSIDYTAAFQIADNSKGNVTITLADGTNNVLKSGWARAGLQKNSDASSGTLTIQGNTGKLTATGGIGAAGIGGRDGRSGSNITISGGSVTATGGWYGAGIGGGGSGSGSDITISGGSVTATGGENAAGIGGGSGGSGSDITISGGSVKATGGEGAEDVGGGFYGSSSNITINESSMAAKSSNIIQDYSIQEYSAIQLDIRFDGDGTAENPYLISTAEQMRAIAADSSLWDKCFRLTADINLGGASNPWTPIGNSNIKFTGTFDGDGHLISGLYGNSSYTDYGLFHTVASEGVIKNLGVSGEFNGYMSTIGSITVNNEGTIENCYSNCTISSTYSTVGGIVGRNKSGGTIINCYNTGSVTNNGECAGGIVGINDGTIETCYNMGTVSGARDSANGYSGQNKCGGIAGKNGSTGIIDDCYNAGQVTSTGGEIGGIVGNGSGTVKNSYYIAGTVSNGNSAGESASSLEEIMEKLSDNWVYDETLGYPVPKSSSQFGSTSGALSVNRWWIQSGANAGEGMYLEIRGIDTVTLGINGINVTTEGGASRAISMITGAVKMVSAVRSEIGAQQNRLEHTIDNENNYLENLTSSESNIRDADMAKEMLELSKANILAQAGVSMLAQANTSNDAVLMLLR